jgi:integrase
MTKIATRQPTTGSQRRHATSPRQKNRVPSLRLHKASGQRYVVLSGKAIYCGYPDDPATEQHYHQAITEWLAAGKQLPGDPEVLTIKELIGRFWVYAEGYYRTITDGRVKELEQFTLALRPLKDLYAETPAAEFGPRALKAVRQKMLDTGWCRPYINKQINRIRHVFKWAVSDELIPGSVLHALQALPGLKRGRSDAYEPEAVKPVPMKLVNAIEPFVSHQVWAMIQLQLFTAARAGEICQMPPCDIDRREEGSDTDREVWVYRPAHHKTAWHGHDRKIYIGPRAQQVLLPFLLRDPQTYCFSPTEAEIDRLRRRRAARVTPLSYGNGPGTNVKDEPQRSAGEQYTTESYRRAIARGSDLAFPLPEPLAKLPDETGIEWRRRLTAAQQGELRAWRKRYRWHPHQLRHNAATGLRKEFGIEAARIILGHRSAAITEVYAEKDEHEAILAIMKVG